MFHEAYLVPKGLEMVFPISDLSKHLGGPDTVCPGLVMSLSCWTHPGLPQEGVEATSQPQGDKHLCLWKIWATLLSNSCGTQQSETKSRGCWRFFWQWVHKEAKMDVMTFSNPTCPRGQRWGYPHTTSSLTWHKDLFQLHYGVWELLLSLGPHLLEAPDSYLGSQLLCKKWTQSSSELLWFLN